jgi:hypothetical protein
MKKYPPPKPVNKNFHLPAYKRLPRIMGIFGSDTQTIAISQAANGKATADVNINIPVWEVVLIATIVSMIVHIMCNCFTRGMKKQFEKNVQKYQVNNVWDWKKKNPFKKKCLKFQTNIAWKFKEKAVRELFLKWINYKNLENTKVYFIFLLFITHVPIDHWCTFGNMNFTHTRWNQWNKEDQTGPQ